VSGAEAGAYLAASLAKQKKYAEAEAPAKAALEPNPVHAVAAAALGESLVGQSKFDEAITRLTTVIKEKADIAYAYYWRAQAYHNKREVARMVEDYQSFLRLAPNAPEAAAVKILLAGLR
jgi:tetratricopeptide (TPR) repeat protein